MANKQDDTGQGTEKDRMKGTAFVEGRFVDISEAKISILDWGFTRSDATYDVVAVWRSRFFRLEDHLDRFLAGLAKLRMNPSYDRAEMREILIECARRSGLEDAYVEMICTRGRPPAGIRDPRLVKNNFMAFVIPYVWIADEKQRQRGLDLAVAKVRRIPPESVDPTVKNYHWQDLTAGIFEAFDRDRETVILLDDKGNLTEGPGFNIFTVKKGALKTPQSGVLMGITRRTVLDLAAEIGLQAQEADISHDELLAADEVFIASTAGGLMPVCLVEGQPVGDGKVGPVTDRLTKLYWEKHFDPEWTTPIL